MARFLYSGAEQQDWSGEPDQEELHGEDIGFGIAGVEQAVPIQRAPDQHETDNHDGAVRTGGTKTNGGPDNDRQRQVQKRRNIAAGDRMRLFENNDAGERK